MRFGEEWHERNDELYNSRLMHSFAASCLYVHIPFSSQTLLFIIESLTPLYSWVQHVLFTAKVFLLFISDE